MFLRIHIDPKHVAVISEDRHQLILPVLMDLYKDVMQSLQIEHVKLFFQGIPTMTHSPNRDSDTLGKVSDTLGK